MVRFVYRFALHNLFSSKVWTIGLWLLFIRPCFGLIGTTSIRPWLRRRLLGLHLVLCFRRVYLGVFFLFGSNSWTIHLCVQGIYPSMFVCPSWIILDKCIKEWRILIQLCTYLKIHHIYISENPNKSKLMQIFVHRYGTCSRASALGNKNTQIHPRIAQKWNTNVLSRGLLKYLKALKKNTNSSKIFNSSRNFVYGHFRPEYGAIIYW